LQNLGAKVLNKEEIYKTSDILIKINCPSDSEISLIKDGAVLIGSFFPHLNKDKINKLLKKNIKIFSLELLPRITRAQSMDILSSQANLAGYKAVIDSVYEFNRAVPMMMTAAGTITPAKFFIIGAGVAGLQAIATAKRLGGVVSATDVRSASKEQVESLGGKFVFVESAKNLETSGGYAKELDQDEKKKQEELLKTTIKTQDIVICTALIPGKKAPRIVSEEMVKSMKSGSVICDLAVEQGGNSAFSEPGKVNVVNGVKIIGYKNFPGRISESASTLFAKNILNFLEIIYDKVGKKLKIDENDEIIKAVYINKEIN
jgi:NAD(P) transhydrogenase subunit alpha